MPPQVKNWTCSICSTDWLLRATGLNPNSNREQVCAQIGYPSCVDEYSGLKDTECLQDVIEQYGVPTNIEWPSWERALEIASSTAFILDSLTMYHFMAGRGLTGGGGLWIANSASGYMGVYETIDQYQWNRLQPWKFVVLLR